MVASRVQSGETVAARPGLLSALKPVSMAVALLVLIQAALAGRWLIDADIIEIHGWIGNLSFLLALVDVVLVFMAGMHDRRMRNVLLGHGVLLVLLMTAQLGLGYAGRDSVAARAWHLPLGVLVFGITVANISMVMRATRGES